MSKPCVSVIVLNYNGLKNNFLPNCIASLNNQTYENIQIIVVDNFSTDTSIEYIKQTYPHITLIQNQENVGFCRGNNIGYYHAIGDYILFANNDTIFYNDTIANLIEGIQIRDDIGMISPKIIRPVKEESDQVVLDSAGLMLKRDFMLRDRGFGEFDREEFNQPTYIFAPCGAAAFYKRETLESIIEDGMVWDENFYAYYEDGDLAWRAHRNGWKCVYYPTAVIIHYRGGSSDHNFFSKPLQFKVHTIKNRYLMIVKNASLRQIIIHSPILFYRELLIWGYLLLHFHLMLDVIKALKDTLLPTLHKRRTKEESQIIDSEHAIFSPHPL